MNIAMLCSAQCLICPPTGYFTTVKGRDREICQAISRLKSRGGHVRGFTGKAGCGKGSALGGAVLLITVGVLEILQGISAISEDDVTVVGPEYTYQFDLTSWGWIHLVLGVLVTAVGIMLFTGATWARVGAIVICSLSILANFLWLPHSPWWSIIIIALDVFVIWAVATWNPEVI